MFENLFEIRFLRQINKIVSTIIFYQNISELLSVSDIKMTWKLDFEVLDSSKTMTANDYIINPDNNNQCKYIMLSQTSFSLYFHNQWTYFYKLSCAGKLKMRAIHTYVECTKAITNDWDIMPLVAIKALSVNISWMAKQIYMIELALESAYQSIYNNI